MLTLAHGSILAVALLAALGTAQATVVKTVSGSTTSYTENFDNGATSGHHWFEGDFTYDGFIDFQDLSLFNTNYDPSKPSLPEPAGTAALCLASLALIPRAARRAKTDHTGCRVRST